ncbi:MAG: ParB/RepB/Spo0J family partition protein [Clostridium sp.]|nr:ParB/RepB/Spo0J family partition protein [Clostridium sp.]MCI7443067.1 ParB/RepB/Spo0J family partition protein [Clostridium sp.]
MSKKFGLGKGLEALISENEENINESGNKLFIPLNKIKNNADQPRKSFDNEKIAELAESIKHHGIIQPLILMKENDDYVIIAGERRWRAAKMVGLKEVPAIIMDVTDKEVLELSLIENIQRQDLNPLEEALAYKKLIDNFKFTQEELSKRIGKSRTAITNCMRLINLDDRVKEYIIQGVLSEGHGRALLAIDDGDLQYAIAQKVIDESLSVRELERLIKKVYATEKKKKNDDKVDDNNIYYKNIEEKLQSYFGTKINLSYKKDKGKIEIEYYSEEDLQRILDMMNIDSM